jgi:hypothetical protein
MVNRRDLLIRDLPTKMRHDGCGGRPGRVELLTGIEGASSRPVRRNLAPTWLATAYRGCAEIKADPASAIVLSGLA